MASNKKLPYSNVIAKVVRLGTGRGVTVSDILAGIQKYQHAPSSLATFYKLYGRDMAEVKLKTIGDVGEVVVQKALDGDLKAAELYLRSKGGWSPTQTNIEVEQPVDPDLDESATSTLMSLLGYNNDAPEETTCACGEEDNCRCSEGVAAE
tara:strand:+ start:377 stop:829 length:453 start_codon:yes stop_codon:yes gene_type:complete